MVIRWDSESDWENSQDSSGATGRNGELKQGILERPDLSSDLVGYWPLDEESGTTVGDYSDESNDGSLTSGSARNSGDSVTSTNVG